MTLPDNKVPDRKKWQTLRDKSGGKKGLSKVSIGKALDAFHAAAAKAKNSGDVAAVSNAMTSLDKDLKAYVAKVSKKKEYNELASTVKREVLSPLSAFRKGFGKMAADGVKEIGRVEKEIKFVSATVTKESGKLLKEFQAINKELSGMARKYGDGVPADDKGDVLHLLKDLTARVKTAKKGVKALDGTLNKLVADHARDHRTVIEKHNKMLGDAKKAVKDVDGEVKSSSGYVDELAAYLKKKAR